MSKVLESERRDNERRMMAADPTRLATPAVDAEDVQRRARVAAAIVADRESDAGRLDAVAGCEFVDDRIRERE